MTQEPVELTIDLTSGPIRALQGGAGPDCVLLHHDVGPHGWTRLHTLLAQRYRVLSPELPGFGASPRAEWARHPRDLAALMLAALRRLGLRDYTLIGPGFGGWVAAEMAVMAYPEMQRLVLLAPAGIKPELTFVLDQVMIEPVAYLQAGFFAPSGFEAHFPEPRAPQLKQRLDACRESVARVTWKPYMYSYELPETLRELYLPVTVAWGREDRVVPFECAALWRQALPECELVVLEGAGHFLDLECPERLIECLLPAGAATLMKE